MRIPDQHLALFAPLLPLSLPLLPLSSVAPDTREVLLKKLMKRIGGEIPNKYPYSFPLLLLSPFYLSSFHWFRKIIICGIPVLSLPHPPPPFLSSATERKLPPFLPLCSDERDENEEIKLSFSGVIVFSSFLSPFLPFPFSLGSESRTNSLPPPP